jgi:tetratricopeptide (TPR) repeat protein
MVRRLGAASVAGCVICFVLAACAAFSDSSLAGTGPRDLGAASEPASGLVLAFEHYLKAHDLEEFQRSIDSSYTEASLTSLASGHDINTRRAAVLALGLSGTFKCNASVARRLKDSDPTVRSLAARSLWAIWRRGDTPQQSAALRDLQSLIEREKFDDAIREATRLIDSAPGFAEAYNQRAIAHFFAGRLAKSADDCRRVLERNPYHFGALDGLAQCQLGLDQRADAIRTFRRSLELQPHSDDLREIIARLEAARD